MAIGVAVYHLKIAIFDVPKIAKSQQELAPQILHCGVRRDAGIEITEPKNLRLLRPR